MFLIHGFGPHIVMAEIGITRVKNRDKEEQINMNKIHNYYILKGIICISLLFVFGCAATFYLKPL
jgi:hypothetical protein